MNTNTRMILTALTARVPLYLEGAPGTGKTETVKAVARWLNRPLVTIIGATRERTDFGGWPRYDDLEGRVKLHPFPWVEELVQAGEKAILFIDEINSNEEIFPVLLRVLSERVIGDIPFEGDVLAAGNPEELSVSGLVLPPPVANRVVHYAWQASPREWARGMLLGWEATLGEPPPPPPPERLEAEIRLVRGLVASFIERHPQLLLQPLKGKTHGPWPSPRSWDLLARFVGAARALGMGEEVQALGAQGAVGPAGYEFFQFLARQDLPHPEELLKDFRLLPQREDAAFASLMAVVSHVTADPTPEAWIRAWELLIRVREEGRPDLVAPQPASSPATTAPFPSGRSGSFPSRPGPWGS